MINNKRKQELLEAKLRRMIREELQDDPEFKSKISKEIRYFVFQFADKLIDQHGIPIDDAKEIIKERMLYWLSRI
jgi:hypothetical protein